MTEKGWNEEKICRCCGKRFTVLHPSRWAYKVRDRGMPHEVYFCSWGCLREDEKRKEAETAVAITTEQKREACEMALRGESPLAYLKGLGVKNPTVGWDSCRAWAAKEWDPDVVEELPRRFGQKKKEEEPEQVVELVYDPSIAEEYRREQAEKAAREAEARELSLEDKLEIVKGYKTTAIRKEGIGEFYFDKVHGLIEWRNEFGDEIFMKPEEWRQLAAEIPAMMNILIGENGAK